MIRFTKPKHNKETKANYVVVDEKEAIERLGRIEDILEKYNIENNIELERLVILGSSAYSRIKLAMGHRVYFLSGKKIRRAHLIGYADNGLSLDELVIEKKGQTATIPYTHLYISRHEVKRAKKGRQLYHLNKKQFESILNSTKYKKKTYLLECGRGTDTFVVVQKVLKAYYKTLLDKEYTLEELKAKFNFDIEKEFPKERKEYVEKAKHIKDKWI